MRKKGIDPNIDTMLLHTMSLAECPDMILYEDVYFTKDAFAKQVYLGANGVFLVIPLVTDELEADGEERSFYMHDLEHLVELKEPEVFLTDLYHYTLDHKLEPSKVPGQYSEIKGYKSGTKKRVSVLDERTCDAVRYEADGTKYIQRDSSSA